MAKLACPATVSPPPTISFPQHFKPWELRLSSICFRSNTLSEQCRRSPSPRLKLVAHGSLWPNCANRVILMCSAVVDLSSS